MHSPDEKSDETGSSESGAGTSSLVESMYDQLRALAASKMAGEAPGQTIGTTVLVHEAYLRIKGDAEQSLKWNSRGHFYGAAAQAMRRILIDRARRKKAVRHGGEWQQVELDSINAPAAAPERSEELLALDEALEELAKKDGRKAKLVELRYFVGLTSAEAAEVLEISKPTADRDWTYARAWLFERIRGEGAGRKSDS